MQQSDNDILKTYVIDGRVGFTNIHCSISNVPAMVISKNSSESIANRDQKNEKLAYILYTHPFFYL